MAVRRLAVSRPSATTDNSLFTADSEYLVSVIATNTNTSSAGLIRVWVVPAGASSVAEYSQIVYDIEVPISNSYETFRFAINQNDVVYVRSSIANMSFTLNGVQQYDIQLGVGVTSFQPTAPSNPINGQLWVDSDALASTVDSSDYLLKTEAATGYYAKTSSASSGEASTVNINTKPWNMPWGIVSYERNTGATLTLTTTTETELFRSPAFTPITGRLYEITVDVGFVQKINGVGNIDVRSRLGSAAGTELDRTLYSAQPVASVWKHSKTSLATSTQLGTSSTVIVITAQTNTNGVTIANTSPYIGAVIIKDIGPA